MAKPYSNNLDPESLVHAEIDRWLFRSKQHPTVMEALEFAEENHFPNIVVLLKILATLSVSNASAERSFSTL